MSRSVSSVLVVLMLVVFSGCASMHVEKYYDDGTFQAKSPSQVRIFRNEPPRPYQVLGTAFSVYSREDEQKMVQEAAAMGADGIIRVLKQENCRYVVSDPERTTVHMKDEDSLREISKPAEYETICDTSYEYNMIRFTD